MSQAYIYGNGGHARVIASFLDADVTFLVEGPAMAADEMSQHVMQDNIADFAGDIYIGIGANGPRTRIFHLLTELGRPPAACVAPTAFVARDATLGAGALICAGAVVGAGTRIGANTIVNTLSSVDHDCRVGDHSQITVGVTIGGTVTIGENCFFGMKSAVLPNVTIGNNVQVRAGSVVTKSVPEDVLVGGIPASLVRRLV